MAPKKASQKQKLTKEDKGKNIAVDDGTKKRSRTGNIMSSGGITINEPTGRQSRTSRNATQGQANVAEPVMPQQAPPPPPRVLMDRNPQRKPSDRELYEALMETEFKASLFPDSNTLRTLGIYDEVEAILDGMGIRSILNMSFEGYKEETCMFLATLRIYYQEDEPGARETGGGRIEFRDLEGNLHRLYLKQLSEIYGFGTEGSEFFETVAGEAEFIWGCIGSGTFIPAKTKGANIRHPAIRYVHKILTHSFGCRREGGTILEYELKFLRLGLAPLIRVELDNEDLFPGLERFRPSVMKMFVEALMVVKTWGWTRKDSTPQLSIGGWVTPILRAANIGLQRPSTAPRFMNINYLNKMRIIIGKVGQEPGFKYIYSFNDIDGANVTFHLPNRRQTTFNRRTNIRFQPDQLPEPVRDDPVEPVNRPRRSAPTAHPSQDQGSAYGCARYYPGASSMPLQPGPLRDLYLEQKKLSRWNMFQDRTTRKLVKQVKKLTSIILKGTTCRGCGADVHFGQGPLPPQPGHDLQEGMDIEGETSRRHSYHGDGSSSQSTTLPPRSSVDAPRRRRLRRMPTPPTPVSDNESPGFSSDEEDFDPNFNYY